MDNPIPDERSGLFWFAKGAARVASIPSIILMFAFMGFSGLCRDWGFTLPQTLAMVASIWALPANVVLVGAVLSKASLLTAMLSVGLSSIRLLPMAVAILPEMRTPKTRKVTLYVLSHFVAITAWVMALERFVDIPKPHRTAYFGGIGFSFLTANLLVVMVTFEIANALPPLLSAALIFITPLYFLFSLWGSAREHHSHFAMGFGLVLTPVFHALSPQTDILLTGITGGILAYVTGQFAAGRAKR